MNVCQGVGEGVDVIVTWKVGLEHSDLVITHLELVI